MNIKIEAAKIAPTLAPHERMQQLVDVLWVHLQKTGVSWIGFYLIHPHEPDDQRLVLGPHCEKPACTPLGMHGVCGQALSTGKIQVVRDVQSLGADYIPCDPRDRSEIVLPIKNCQDSDWIGVLDLDSWEEGAFDHSDAEGLGQVLVAAGFKTA